MQKFLCTLLSLWLFTVAIGQAGSLDPTYGTSGIKLIAASLDLSNYTLVKTYPDDNGGRYEILMSPESSDFVQTVITKYLQDGRIDVTFGNSGYVSFPGLSYFASDRQSDGRITIAGGIGNSFTPTVTHIFRLNTDGSITNDIQVGLGFGSYYSFVQGLTLQNDRVVVTGKIVSPSLNPAGYWVRILNADNSVSSITAGDNYTTSDGNPNHYYDNFNFGSPLNIALEGDKVVVGGPIFYRIETVGEGADAIQIYYRDYFIAKYKADGSLDTKFDYGATYPFPASYPDDTYTPKTTLNKSVAFSPVANPQTGNTDFKVTVYNLDGTLDQNFGTNGSTRIDFGGNDVPKAYVWQGDKLIIGGNSTNSETDITTFALARLNSDGSPDPSFDADGKQLTFQEGYDFDMQRLTIQTKGLQSRLLAVGDELIAGYLLENNVLLTCTQGKTVAADAGACNAIISGIDPVLTPSGSGAIVNYTMTGATTGSGTGSVSGTTFNKGVTTVTYTLAANPSQTCTFTVAVEDREAPVVSNLSASTTSIFPPNHKLVDVWIGYNASDNCGATTSLSVSSNEAETSNDPEDIAGDFVVVDNHHVQLRAERLNSGNGRIYTVTVTATDAAGNSNQRTIPIAVPKSMGKKSSTVVRSKGEVPMSEAVTGLQVRVLSNPATDRFTLLLQSASREPLRLQVSDAQGRLVQTQPNHPLGTMQLGSGFRPGVYYVQVQQGAERRVLKLVKLAN